MNSDCNGCIASNGVANLIGVTVNLGPLALNGGPTETMMPLPGSPAINAGNPQPPGTEGFDSTDQRGFSRLNPSGGLDIGAVQTHYSSVSFLAQPSNTLPNQTVTPAVAAQVVEVDTALAITNYPLGVPVNVSLQDTQGVQVTGVLTGTLTQSPAVSSGVTSAVFPDLALNTAGTYKLFATTAISGNSASADPAYSATSNSFQIAGPVITWQPAPIIYGPMPAGELNASATLFGSPATGTFVYTFVATGATINIGQVYPAASYAVQVAFTPTGTTTPYTLPATLQINPATPVLTWASPAPIFTSTALSATQLDATAAGITGAVLPGAFVYNPAAGATLAAGSQLLKTTFTPTDTVNYTTVTAQVTIQVNAPTAATVVIQESANPITFGQSVTLTAVVTGSDGRPFSGGTATFTADGTGIGSASIVNGSGSVTAASLTGGTRQIGVSYTNSSLPAPLTNSAALTVNKAAPVLKWTTPAAITTSTPLGATQLDATATGVTSTALAGTFAYTPTAGTMLSVGPQVLSTTFTPTDAVDYTTASAQVTIQVNYSPIAITSVSPNTTPLSTSPLPIAISGSGFTSTSVAELNGTPIATIVQSATALTATIPASNLAATGTLSLTVYDTASKFTSNIVQIKVTAPPADVTVSVPPTTGSGEQPGITIALNSPYPSDLSGALALTFAPKSANGVDDPAVQFSTGGRTFNFTVAAGTTTTPAVALQTGTVAGTITVTLALTTGGVDVTPPGVSPITLVIAAAAPAITSVKFTNDSAGLITVVINGFSNTRDMTQATFVFTGSDAQSLGSAQVQIPVSSLFSPWYSSSASDQYGSEFTYTQNFQLSKPDSNITGVAATLANSIGTSGSVNSQ